MESLVNHLFEIIVTGLGSILVIYFKEMKTDVKEMSGNMAEMNVKLEKVITDQTWHKEEIAEIKERVKHLEEAHQ